MQSISCGIRSSQSYGWVCHSIHAAKTRVMWTSSHTQMDTLCLSITTQAHKSLTCKLLHVWLEHPWVFNVCNNLIPWNCPFPNVHTIVSRKSTHGRVCQKGGVGILSSVSAFSYERASMSCLHALEANNLQWSHQRLWSWVLTAHNTLNDTMSS